MHFELGSYWYLALLLLLPCFIWCKPYAKTYYFPKLSWISRHNIYLPWSMIIKLVLYSSMVFLLSKPFLYNTRHTPNKKGRDLILALDASGSMAQSGFDSKNRFVSKFDINLALASDFIKKRYDDNMGIVIFGTFAYTASPLTYDLNSLKYILHMINAGIAGESTAIGDAIMQSIEALSFGDAKNKAIILLTDGYHNAGNISPKEAVSRAKELGIKIYTIGLGDKSQYDTELLHTISKETKAKSYAASDAKSLKGVYSEIDRLEPSKLRSENYLQQKLLVFMPLSFVFVLFLTWSAWIYRKRQ